MVEAVAVIVEAGFRVEVFGREAVTEDVGERTGLRYGVTESVVGVLRNCGTGRVEVTGYVAVVVVERDVDRGCCRRTGCRSCR